METTFKSVNEMVTDRLRESILSGELAEGEYLRQQAQMSQQGGDRNNGSYAGAY